jgi:hypothetical protein
VTVTLDPVLPTADAGVVADGRQADPEVPERARRRAFTSSYKPEILAAYDGALDVQLRLPKEMGGEGGGTNPEQLFAVGYAGLLRERPGRDRPS